MELSHSGGYQRLLAVGRRCWSYTVPTSQPKEVTSTRTQPLGPTEMCLAYSVQPSIPSPSLCHSRTLASISPWLPPTPISVSLPPGVWSGEETGPGKTEGCYLAQATPWDHEVTPAFGTPDISRSCPSSALIVPPPPHGVPSNYLSHSPLPRASAFGNPASCELLLPDFPPPHSDLGSTQF